MIYIVDNILNYFIYLFILYFGFRLRPRSQKIFLGLSVSVMLCAGGFNAYFDINSPAVYIFWSVLSISLFFEERLGHLLVLSAAIMYFTGIIDTFSVMLIQIVLIGGGAGTDITWWMETAYLLSFLIYLLIYLLLLRKNEVYLCDIQWKYQLALLIQGGIFQLFYNFVFVFFEENHAMYGWDAYAVFFISIAGAIYSVFLTLGLAIKNILSGRQNRKLQSFMHMQKQQYEYQMQQSAAVRRFKHDLTNHIGVLRELMNQEKTEEAKAYIDTIWGMQDSFEQKVHTGDSFLDVIMNYYAHLAEKEKIAFTVSGKLAENMHLEMVDITTMVGNILQNAVEAAVQAVVPKIRVELVEHRKEIFITVSNSVRRAGVKRDFYMTSKMMTSKMDRENHGLGLKNVTAAVEKYHGEYYMESTVENGEDTFQISIAIPKESSV